MRTLLLSGIAAGLALLPQAAFADSFLINEYSARDLGLATAGRTTLTSVSAAWGNPALLPLLGRPTAGATVSGILGDADYEDFGSRDVLGRPLGGNTGDPLQDAIVPALHAAWPLGGGFTFGLSLTSPFGLSTKYDSVDPQRYQALKSSLRTADLNPSLSYRINDMVSVGAGISFQYAKAQLTSLVDFGAVCLSRLPAASCASAGLRPQGANGLVDVEGDDISAGWNLGLAVTPDPAWTIGLTYRSQVDHRLKGTADFSVPAAALPLTAGGAFTDTPGSAKLSLPATAEIGACWQTNDRLALYGSFQWKDWSHLQRLAVDFKNPVQPDTVEPLNYVDSLRISLGAEYQVTPQIQLRAGIAGDQSPTKAQYRTARIPDNDRLVYALGASWTPREDWSLDLAWNRIDIDDTPFDRTGAYGERVLGLYTGHADVVSVGTSLAF